jgi:hypothetical protein
MKSLTSGQKITSQIRKELEERCSLQTVWKIMLGQTEAFSLSIPKVTKLHHTIVQDYLDRIEAHIKKRR